MSCSRSKQTPVDYLHGSHNVLWQLQPSEEDDTGYHHGADISAISQFASEEEVLFPPGTMLVVQTRDAPEGGGGGAQQPLEVTEGVVAAGGEDGEVTHYTAVRVLPCFV